LRLVRRRVLALLAAALFFLFPIARANAQAVIPDTPAGHTLQSWLNAFNSGDRAKLDAYIKSTGAKDDVDWLVSFRNQTGGFDLLSIESSAPLEIKFRVKEKTSATTAFGDIVVKDSHPPTIENFGLRALPPGAVIEDKPLDAVTRQQVLDGIYKNLADFYVYLDTAQKMSDGLRAHARHGDYDSITNGTAFAERLTADLREVSHDKHLGVTYNPFKTPNLSSTPEEDTQQRDRFRASLQHDNCGFQKVEILSGNIGYLKFNMFAPPDVCGPTASAAMNFLAHTDAVIFDLRQNGGGDPAMIAYLSSYLFDDPTHLNDLYDRHEDSTHQWWTLPYVPGDRIPASKPVFILTSHDSFSGAEEFTYNLKNLKRATVIGETTGGGAHPVSPHPIGDYFVIDVPYARAINPITKTNWEGTGVKPDVSVPANDALDTAIKMATQKIRSSVQSP
jgi:retinol-binding protein 3